jgi:hypothetical protein
MFLFNLVDGATWLMPIEPTPQALLSLRSSHNFTALRTTIYEYLNGMIAKNPTRSTPSECLYTLCQFLHHSQVAFQTFDFPNVLSEFLVSNSGLAIGENRPARLRFDRSKESGIMIPYIRREFSFVVVRLHGLILGTLLANGQGECSVRKDVPTS